MPKKVKLTSKEESQRVKDKKILTQDETNSLEQMIQRDEGKMDLSEIKEILRESGTEKLSPSLEKVNAPQRTPTRLEGNVGNAPPANNNTTEEDDAFKYTSGEVKTGETKYVRYEGKIIDNMISRREIESLKMEKPFERRTVAFEAPQRMENSEKNNLEKYSPIKKVDKDQLGKEKPFNKGEIKYNPEKY